MRWRLLRRRLSISAPRMTVRSHLPWPVRWAAAAIALGFSGALALWAFEVGRGLTGVGRSNSHAEEALNSTRTQLEGLRQDHQRALSIANTADSLLKTERATQQRLAEQVKSLEMENQALKDDLGFFERLLPTAGEGGLSVRGLQADLPAAGQLRFQVLVMQRGGRAQPEFKGRYEVLLSGLIDGRPWTMPGPVVSQALQVKQYRRIEGLAEYPSTATIKQVQVRVLDERGQVQATQSVKL